MTKAEASRANLPGNGTSLPVASASVSDDCAVLRHALDAAHINDVECESACAERVHALCAVALAEAEQTVHLPHLGPRQGTLEQAMREETDVLALGLGGAA